VRRLARFRARFAPALLLLPAILVASFDVARRWQRMQVWTPSDALRYGAAWLESGVLWGALLLLASRRRGALRWAAALAFVVVGALSLGTERYFYDQFETYLNADAVLFGAAFPASLPGQLAADAAGLAVAVAVPLLYFVALAVAARKWLRPPRRSLGRGTWAALGSVAVIAVLPCSFRTVQAAPPDVIFLHAMGRMARQLVHGKPAHVEPGVRRPPYLPVISPAQGPARNVLLVLTESVRFDAVCTAYELECARSPFTNRAVPGRVPFLQMRSNSSTTAISFAVLLSGLGPTEARTSLHDAPLLFDYAHAAGYDTAYWTSQHLMFAHSEEFVRDLPVSRRCGGADLDPDADIDMGASDHLLTARASHELPLLREPWFAVVHYSSTHFPYRVVEGDQPFQPASSSKAPDDNAELLNYYQNAVYAQDRTIADLLIELRSTEAGRRTVVVYTSDHGEAFREHGQLGHTGAVLDEEIHVPTWIDAPQGTLTPDERSHLVGRARSAAWHVDLAPTFVDLLRLRAVPELGRFHARMSGTSLLQKEPTQALVPLTNCSELWGCAFRNWGLMRGSLKLEAREWDFDWHCWDVVADPFERRDLGARACGDLQDAAERLFGGLPRNAADPAGPLTAK
jgi:glucan phosphoethanolaminetransferase (alkaline phosphatase superfamily)